jgi:hypothetical protein
MAAFFASGLAGGGAGAPSAHRFKHSCFRGRAGERVVLYDNERGKGDHRHCGAREDDDSFRDVETLIADFTADVRRLRGGSL